MTTNCWAAPQTNGEMHFHAIHDDDSHLVYQGKGACDHDERFRVSIEVTDTRSWATRTITIRLPTPWGWQNITIRHKRVVGKLTIEYLSGGCFTAEDLAQ